MGVAPRFAVTTIMSSFFECVAAWATAGVKTDATSDIIFENCTGTSLSINIKRNRATAIRLGNTFPPRTTPTKSSREETLDHQSAHPVRMVERPRQAGLLALGSSFTPHLPGPFYAERTIKVPATIHGNPVAYRGANSPITVAGAAPDCE